MKVYSAVQMCVRKSDAHAGDGHDARVNRFSLRASKRKTLKGLT